MHYLLLIYSDEKADAKMSPAEAELNMKEWFAFDGWITESGSKVGGHALHSVEAATTVRKKGGKTVTVDGPFAETKEQLGGYYMVDVKNLDEAIAIAERMPVMGRGSVEIRPIVIFDEETGQPQSL